MKKLAIYLSIVLLLFALLWYIERQSNKVSNAMNAEEAQQLYSTTPDKLNAATREQLTNPNYQNIILPDELQQKLDDQEDVFVYFFSPLCPYCVATTPKLNAIAADAGVEIRQYNVLEYEQAWQQYIESTPTLIYFKDGVPLKDSIVGGYGAGTAEDSRIEADYINFFEKNKAAE